MNPSTILRLSLTCSALLFGFTFAGSVFKVETIAEDDGGRASAIGRFPRQVLAFECDSQREPGASERSVEPDCKIGSAFDPGELARCPVAGDLT